MIHVFTSFCTLPSLTAIEILIIFYNKIIMIRSKDQKISVCISALCALCIHLRKGRVQRAIWTACTLVMMSE